MLSPLISPGKDFLVFVLFCFDLCLGPQQHGEGSPEAPICCKGPVFLRMSPEHNLVDEGQVLNRGSYTPAPAVSAKPQLDACNRSLSHAACISEASEQIQKLTL